LTSLWGTICEFRVYEAAKGKASAFQSRLIDEVVPKLVSGDGIEVLRSFVGAYGTGVARA
jgi:hypothetical protein